MLATTLDATGGGNANYTVPAGGLQNVARIEYMGANSSGQTYSFPGITYHANGTAGPINNYLALAGTSGGQVVLNAGLTVNGNIDIVTKQMQDNAGAGALNPGTGSKWHIWSTNTDPYGTSGGTADNLGGLSYDFKQYGASYGTTTPAESGNGYLLTYAPTLALAIINNPTKTYDGNTTATLSSNNYSLTGGAVGGDNVSLVTANLPTSGVYNDPNVVGATSVTVASVNPSAVSATQTLAGPKTVNVYGYTVSPNTTGPGSITPAALGVYATPTYNGGTSFGINGGTSGNGTVDTGGTVKVAGLVNGEN